VPPDRDVAAFEARARDYEGGWLGRMHHQISERTADLVVATDPDVRRLLDVGCGTGYLLRLLAERYPDAELAGIDPAPSMIGVAAGSTVDDRVGFVVGSVEGLPCSDGEFDLVVATTSFDHWADQEQGLRECARVLRPGGRLVLVDQFSPWLAPTLLFGRRGKARTERRCARLLDAAGFVSIGWHGVYAAIIRAVVATT
jgi:ubiquinone/menaquinone biosynthesis C-methylase UbiE